LEQIHVFSGGLANISVGQLKKPGDKKENGNNY
jgi:hypothetical protein